MNWPGHSAALPRSCGVHTLSFLFILAPFLIRRKIKTAYEALTYREALNHAHAFERRENLKLFLTWSLENIRRIKSNQIRRFTTSAALHVSHVFSTLEINWFMQAVWVKHAGGRAQDNCCLLWIHSKHSITFFLKWVKLSISWTLTELDETLNALSRAKSLVQSPSTSGNV